MTSTTRATVLQLWTGQNFDIKDQDKSGFVNRYPSQEDRYPSRYPSDEDEYEMYEDDEFYEDHYDDTEDVIYEDYPGLQSHGALCDSNHFLCQSQVGSESFTKFIFLIKNISDSVHTTVTAV